jgi:SAM-dependent methyltransferase
MAADLRNFVVHQIHDRVLARAASQYFRGRLIDIGCGEKPYREMMASLVAEHVGVDHEGTTHRRDSIDLFGSAYAIPVPDGSFDSALCTGVLEHLEEPEAALRECFRVLRAGGHAIYSVPFIWHLHEEPRDFYRFSKHGLQYLFTKVGFEVLDLQALSGFWTTFATLTSYNLSRWQRGPLRWIRAIDLMTAVGQLGAYAFDKLDRAEQWTWMYTVVARKP